MRIIRVNSIIEGRMSGVKYRIDSIRGDHIYLKRASSLETVTIAEYIKVLNGPYLRVLPED